MQYDKIIIGAGLYGLYSALFCCKRGQNVIVLECDSAPFKRATYVNQARVHQGYHYPRSISTAMKSAGYFERFNKDYSFASIENLTRFMQRQLNTPGRMEDSLKSFVRQQIFHVKNYIREIFLKRVCVMEYLEPESILMMR